MASNGWLGDFDPGNIFAALGQSLLTSPRENWLQGLPAGVAAVNKRTDATSSRNAMIAALRENGFDEATAATMAANPEAAKLAVQGRTAHENARLYADDPFFGGGGAAPAAPAAVPGARPGNLGGLGGGPVPPSFAGGSTSMKMPADPEIENRFIGAVREGGLTNPFGLAAVAAYANAESGYSPKNITGSWADPSESGQPGTSGGILSWRGPRLAAMRAATGGGADPVVAQAKFLLTENPDLTMALQNAKSPEEAHTLMANAWKFAGYDRPGGENARRLAMTRSYVERVGGQPGAPASAGSAPMIATNEAEVQELERATGMVPGGATRAPAPVRLAQAGGTPGSTQSDAGGGVSGGERPIPRNEGTAAARAGISAMPGGGYQQPKTPAEAYRLAMAIGKRIQLYAGRKMPTEALQTLQGHYLKLATPTDLERQVDAAGLVGEERTAALLRAIPDHRSTTVRDAEAAYPDDPRRQREVVANSISDQRPDLVRMGQAAQDTPGLVRSGVEAESARKGADTRATSRETALTREAEGATQGGRVANRVLSALDEAERAYDRAAAGGGTGAFAASGLNRAMASALPSGLPTAFPARKNEIARQQFDSHIAAVTLAKSAVDLKGQGAVSNFERTLASADVPSLSSTDPSVAKGAFARLRADLKAAQALDDRLGLHAGETKPAPRGGQAPGGSVRTPYGVIREVP